jgi:hypothetical protein
MIAGGTADPTGPPRRAGSAARRRRRYSALALAGPKATPDFVRPRTLAERRLPPRISVRPPISGPWLRVVVNENRTRLIPLRLSRNHHRRADSHALRAPRELPVVEGGDRFAPAIGRVVQGIRKIKPRVVVRNGRFNRGVILNVHRLERKQVAHRSPVWVVPCCVSRSAPRRGHRLHRSALGPHRSPWAVRVNRHQAGPPRVDRRRADRGASRP